MKHMLPPEREERKERKNNSWYELVSTEPVVACFDPANVGVYWYSYVVLPNER